MGIVVHQVSKKLGKFQALNKVNLTIKKGKLLALLGPSGSGKSTLLRVIAGLERPDAGSIIINGQDSTYLEHRKRKIGFVFQHYALFKHLTVWENIAFGLKIRQKSSDFIKQKVEELLQLIQLQGFENRYPFQLSGGQRQRVALARSLAVEPEFLLLDEPFGALDTKVSQELGLWLRKLHEQVNLTSVFVTHDQEEAMAIADEIVIMNQGKIEQIGTPAQIYDYPANAFVMSFMGEVNILDVTAPFFNLSEKQPINSPAFIRPDEIEIHFLPERNSLEATLQRLINLGSKIQLELLLLNRANFRVYLSKDKLERIKLQKNQKVFVKLKNPKFFVNQAK